MVRSFFLLPILIAFIPVVGRAGDEKPSSVIYNSEAGQFSVTLPKKPTKQFKKIPTDVGEVEIRFYIVDLNDKVYLTGFSDYPTGSVTDANRTKVLEGARDGNVASYKGKLVSDKKITLGVKKVEGREILVEVESIKGFARTRLFLKGDRLYQVVALGAGDWAKSDTVTKYLDSFEIED